MKPVIYAYRLTSDSGSAPCIYDLHGNATGLLTLACCKGGQIRYKGTTNEREIKTGLRHTIGKNHKEEIANGRIDVYVMGIYKNTLLYFAKITEVLSMRDYFSPKSRYKNRHDDIYDVLPDDIKRNDNNPAFHPKEETTRHRLDWLGEYALISDCFAFWGKDSKAISKCLIDILPKYRESKLYKGDSPHCEQVMDELSILWNFKDIIQNEPHNYQRNQSRKGCGQSENNLVPERV